MTDFAPYDRSTLTSSDSPVKMEEGDGTRRRRLAVIGAVGCLGLAIIGGGSMVFSSTKTLVNTLLQEGDEAPPPEAAREGVEVAQDSPPGDPHGAAVSIAGEATIEITGATISLRQPVDLKNLQKGSSTYLTFEYRRPRNAVAYRFTLEDLVTKKRYVKEAKEYNGALTFEFPEGASSSRDQDYMVIMETVFDRKEQPSSTWIYAQEDMKDSTLTVTQTPPQEGPQGS